MMLRLILFVSVLGLVSTQESDPVVKLSYGVLQGSWQVSSKGRTYASFQGVPYARPPIGKYRFKEPQELKPWTGTWYATRPLSGCLQFDPFSDTITGSENCLYVNVHTPNLSSDASLPVMVFIHGGAFMYGEGGLYGPSNFMDWDMVIVTLNYRLGPLGFLSTEDEVIPGNNGLKDQSFALHWVKNNIKMFGGNPDSITLTGCSAGGASVHYHYLSPLSRGTFNRGIAFSGSAFASWTHAIRPAQKAKTLASMVGCPTDTSKDILECLKYRPAEVIVKAQGDMFGWKVHLFTLFTPTIEATGVQNAFLTKYPYHAAIAGEMMKVPLITTVTAQEGLYPAAAYLTDAHILGELESRWQELASNIFEYNDTLPLKLRPSVATKIKQHYLAGKPVSLSTYPQLIEALSDRLFVADVGRLAEIHAQKSGQPTYVYKYSYRGTTSLSNTMGRNNEDYGVCHADDVLHVFKFPYMEAKTPDDFKIIDSLIGIIYSFASTGVPKAPGVDTEWLPVKPGDAKINYLEIYSPTKMEMKASFDFGQRSFWDKLGLIENENYIARAKDEL